MYDDLKLSEEIEVVLHFFERCKLDYRWHESQLEAEENLGNTLRHEIEGVGVEFKAPPKYKDRARLATGLQEALISRRIAKDLIAVYKPMVDFVDSDVGKNAINHLKQKLGEVRKIEEYMQDRTFYKRRTKNAAPVTEANKANQDNFEKMVKNWKKGSKQK